MGNFLNYTPPGAISQAFLDDRSSVRAIMGPIGSGKTSACVIDILTVGMMQQPSQVDGVRYSKFAVIRDTYRNLTRTTIKTFKTWIPKGMGKWTGGGNEPATLEISFGYNDGRKYNILVEFIALGDNNIEDVMRGWEGTGAWLNEADRLPPEALSFIRGRVGRYPSKIHGGPSWYGVILDYNAPDTENYLYHLFEELRPEGFILYRQPGGFEKGAENYKNLPDDYYKNQCAGQPDWYIRRMIHNEYGYSRDGKPVYSEYNDNLHCSTQDFDVLGGVPLVLGADQGLTPAIVILQQAANGQWLCHDEIIIEGGAISLSDHLKRRLNNDNFKNMQIGSAWADPAGDARSQNDEISWLETLSHHSGIAWDTAPSQDPEKRVEAVRQPLQRMIDGHHPGLLIHPRCKVLRKGFNSGYRYKKSRVAGSDSYQDKPEKNQYSHIHDALQYGLLGGGEYNEIVGRSAAPRMNQTIIVSNNMNIWGV